MTARSVGLVVVLMFPMLLAGCIEQQEQIDEHRPYFVGFEAETLGRGVDGGASINFNQDIDGPKLVLWVASGCQGCHDWTRLFLHHLENTTDLDGVNIVYIHRYASLETKDSVMNVYGKPESETYSPWPILLPDETTVVYDEKTNRPSKVSIYEAFSNPVTPTFQIVDAQGALLWQSKTYWANETVFEDAIDVYNKVRT